MGFNSAFKGLNCVGFYMKRFILNSFLFPVELLTLADFFKNEFYVQISCYHGDRYIHFKHVGCNTAHIVSASSVFRVGVSPRNIGTRLPSCTEV